MKKLLTLIIMITSLLVAGSAQGKSYRLINCRGSRGQNHYAVTAFAPGGCDFGKAAYRPLLSFALGAAKHGSVTVRYHLRNYQLGCALIDGGLLGQCGVRARPYVRLYLDSSEAPPDSRWPTHT